MIYLGQRLHGKYPICISPVVNPGQNACELKIISYFITLNSPIHMNLNSSISYKLITGCILLATLSSCNLTDDLQAARAAGEPLHASGVNVQDGVSTGSGHVVHLKFTGVPGGENTDGRAQASAAAAIFFASLEKKRSFDSIEVTLEKTTSITTTYTFPGKEVKKICDLYERVVKPFNRNMDDIEKLKTLSDPAYLSDSALRILQQSVTEIESTHGKIAATHFRGFANATDSSGKPAFLIKCTNFNAKGEPIMLCKFVFFQNNDKVAGEQVGEVETSVDTSGNGQGSKAAK